MAGLVWGHRQQKQFFKHRNTRGHLYDYRERYFGDDFFLGYVPIGRAVTLRLSQSMGAPFLPERLLLWLFPRPKTFNRKVRQESRGERRVIRFCDFLSVLRVFTPRSLRLKAFERVTIPPNRSLMKHAR